MATELASEPIAGDAPSRWETAPRRFLESPWAVASMLLLALLIRFYRAADWSLWEDEETSIYFSQQLDKPFARFFPLFFWALHGLYETTGVSVAAGRYACAALGVLSVWLTYTCVRTLTTRSIALGSAFLLTINLGHLFWSQSIRYFVLLFSFQLLSFFWFLLGLERGKIVWLLLSQFIYALCLLTHFSALLMTPVFIAYLLLMVCGKQRGGAYNLRGYLTFGFLHIVLLTFFLRNILKAQNYMGGVPNPILRDPLHVVATSLSYFGLPTAALALLAPFVPPLVPRRILVFFFLAAVLPVLELVVMAGLNLTNVTWYNAFFSLFALVALASMTVVSLYQNGFRRLSAAGGSLAVIFSLILLSSYFTVMRGDRPRWKDAVHYLRSAAQVRIEAANNPKIFATVPGVVAFYLGVPPGQTMDNLLVRGVRKHPSDSAHLADEWYVVESGQVSPDWQSWLENCCTLTASFVARTGPKDRTVFVYHYAASPNGSAREE